MPVFWVIMITVHSSTQKALARQPNKRFFGLENNWNPTLFRVDVGKTVYYALDEEERRKLLERLAKEGVRGKMVVTRFKGLGEMNPGQLRETTMAPQSRRLAQLTISAQDKTDQLMDMMLAKKRASDRREWLEEKGNLAELS